MLTYALAVVSAVLLEVFAPRLARGFLSPSSAVAMALTSLGLGPALAAVLAALLVRIKLRGGLAEAGCDFVCAAISSLGLTLLGLGPATLLMLGLNLILPALLLKTLPTGRSPQSLRAEQLALLSLGPLAVVLARQGPEMALLCWPLGIVLMTSASRSSDLAVLAVRSSKQGLIQKEESLTSEAQRQALHQQTLDARHEAFCMMERLSAQLVTEQQAIEEALSLITARFPQTRCSYYEENQGLLRALYHGAGTDQPPMSLVSRCCRKQRPHFEGEDFCWPLLEHRLLWIQGALSESDRQTLEFFVSQLALLVDRVRVQQSLLVALEHEENLRQQLSH